ncbi:hypothetical protein CU098_008408 [Rhizopus stolonifer]|uniref:Uncharacterized protein n=1 Tax=Rhizopus stolonifer TaxID=4846 RepID=A0A367IWZ9_RHIST|nr:hypothetical protein CU098_008408 [Rhizopus stolonifer]
MASQTMEQKDLSNLIHRLKLRLALANFKREHGYENVDLRTLESSLYEHKLTSIDKYSNTTKIQSPTRIPLSATRLEQSRKISLSSDDEDAAHLLVLMHQSPTMSS